MGRERVFSDGAKESLGSPERLLMESFGCVEILPQEQDYLPQIRWEAYKIRTALRLGQEGLFICDPDCQLNTDQPTDEEISYFECQLRSIATKKGGSFKSVFPEIDPVLIEGIERRIANDKQRKKQLNEAFNSPNKDQRLRLAYCTLKKLSEKTPEDKAASPQTNVLLVAHTNTPDSHKIAEKASGILQNPQNPSLIDNITSTLNVALMGTMTPYLGAAVVGAELESSGIKDISIIDYKQVTEEKISQLKPDIAMLTGSLSIDIRDLQDKSSILKRQGVRTLVGGLAATIDPNAVILLCNADVFIGEAEGAMDKIISIYTHADTKSRFIFHRTKRPGSKLDETEIIEDDRIPYLKHVYLNLPKYVDIEKHYSREKEKAGQLASRLKYEWMMRPTIDAFGKKWDPPSWIFKQIAITQGCPHGCDFCSTVKAIGREIRRKPIESIDLELKASEAKGTIVVDQNLGAIGGCESYQDWSAYFEELLTLFLKHDKRLVCQTELSTWDRINQYPKLRALASQTIIASLGGIEKPRIIKGNKDKNPSAYPKQIEIMRKLGIISVVTAFSGSLVKDGNNNPDEDIPLSEWKEFLTQVRPDILSVFPAIRNPGSPGVAATYLDSENPLSGYQQMSDERDWTKAFEIEKLVPSSLLRTSYLMFRNGLPKRAVIFILIKAIQDVAHQLKVHPTQLMRKVR